MKWIVFSIIGVLFLAGIGLWYFNSGDSFEMTLGTIPLINGLFENVEDTRDILYDKTYNSSSKTIEITRNSSGDTMAYLTLISDEHEILIINGMNQTNATVLELDFTQIENSMKNLISGVPTYLENKQDEVIGTKNRSIYFQWREQIGQKWVDNYTEECTPIEDSGFYNCTDIYQGQYREPIYKWNDFNPMDIGNLPKETIRIRGLADIYVGERIEWHLEILGNDTTQGVLIDEWADFSTYTRYEFYLDENGGAANIKWDSGDSRGQQFTVGITGTNESFTVEGFSMPFSTGDTGATSFYIDAQDGSGYPDGSHIASVEVVQGDITGNWVNLSFDSTGTLVAGGNYVFHALSSEGTLTIAGKISYNNGYDSTRSTAVRDNPGWSDEAFDFAFEIWGTPAPAGDSVVPNVTSPTEYPTDSTEYSPGKVYWFNATVVDDIQLDNVTLEFDGVNYSASNISDNYYKSLSDLAVGTYNYRWIAVDNSSNVNNSITGNYTIDKNDSYITSLLLSVTSPITYGTSSDFAGSGCPSQLSCNLDISNAVYGVGVSPVTGNYSTIGNGNYTPGSDTASLTINIASGSIWTLINNSRANKAIENASWLNLTAYLETGLGNIELYNNGTKINNGVSPLYNSTQFVTLGNYNITSYYGGNENYTSSFEQWNVSVSLTPPATPSNCSNGTVILNSPTSSNLYGRLCYWVEAT